jgi:CelD/BcsL family acetyltransferase involved in cellulose biosynthesis
MAMLANAIRRGSDDGVTEFAFLRGNEPYKYRFASDDLGLDSVSVVRGPVAGAGLAVIQAVRSSPTARNVLRGFLDM